MDCRPLSYVPRRLPIIWQASKCVGEVSVHFHLELDTLGVVNVSTDKNLKDWGRANVGATTSKILCEHILAFVLGLVWEAHCWRMFNHFRYTLCKYSTLFSPLLRNMLNMLYWEKYTQNVTRVYSFSCRCLVSLHMRPFPEHQTRNTMQ
jgi:hypothetical protein